MKKLIVILITLTLPSLMMRFGGRMLAQQDPQYSQYMFNQLVINPAYAGSKEAISSALFLRAQWSGIEGAPRTESISVHGPLKKRKVGLGFAVIADQIGPKQSIGALGSYAYKIRLGKGKLAFGLRAGVYNYVYNWNDIIYKDQADVYNTHTRTSIIVPTADAGMYYYTNTVYAGVSATHLYNGRLTNVSNLNGDDAALSPHLFVTLGKGWEISDQLTFNPSCAVKVAKNTPASVDLNFSFLLQQRIWLGVSARSNKTLVIYAQMHITEKFKVGYSMDVGFNKIERAGGPSHELMLSYDFNIYKSKILSPRHAYF
ncbi:MAG TPA: type IX secretion system membrane protein PorP/SprF [Bacteroidia bacterium]|jgi:type IX secretion system PorP/SprF family membrane protein